MATSRSSTGAILLLSPCLPFAQYDCSKAKLLWQVSERVQQYYGVKVPDHPARTRLRYGNGVACRSSFKLGLVRYVEMIALRVHVHQHSPIP